MVAPSLGPITSAEAGARYLWAVALVFQPDRIVLPFVSPEVAEDFEREIVRAWETYPRARTADLAVLREGPNVVVKVTRRPRP